MSGDVVLSSGYLKILPFGAECAKKGCTAKWGLLQITPSGIIRCTCTRISKPHSYSMCQQCGKLISSDNLWRHQNYGKKGCGADLSNEELHAVIYEREARRKQIQKERSGTTSDEIARVSASLDALKKTFKSMHSDIKTIGKKLQGVPVANPVSVEVPTGLKPSLELNVVDPDLQAVKQAKNFGEGLVRIIRSRGNVHLRVHNGYVYWNNWPIEEPELIRIIVSTRKKLQALLSKLMIVDQDKLVGSSICLLSQDLFRNLHTTSKAALKEVLDFKHAVRID